MERRGEREGRKERKRGEEWAAARVEVDDGWREGGGGISWKNSAPVTGVQNGSPHL